MQWTVEQVLALAPDASSEKSGKDLSAPRKWLTLGVHETCAWGTLQGSGKLPYQTSIDLSGPAFKCTCPSRKFPCKHGLGLFLVLAQQPGAMTETEPPAWTSEWIAQRSEREDKKSAKTAAPVQSDPENALKSNAAAEKRSAAREATIMSGLEELSLWLCDLVRTGLASLPGRPSSFWETPAARLVDSQAPGLARRLRALDGITAVGEHWPALLLREAALLHLACQAWSRLTSLSAETQADLRSLLGFTTRQEEILSQPGQRDHWLVIGQRIEEEDRLRTQRTWLFGSSSQRPALCLSFSAGPNQPLDISLTPGSVVDAELCFFPSAWPLRALVKERHGSSESAGPQFPHQSIAAAHTYAAQALTAHPWLERIPLALASVTPLRRAQGWMVRDEASRCLPLQISDEKAWLLMALSGGRPIAMAGEWNGQMLLPLSVWAEGRFVRL